MSRMIDRFKSEAPKLTCGFCVAVSLLFSLASVASAQSGGAERVLSPQQQESSAQEIEGPPHHRRDGGKAGALLSRLNLTPEQREQIRQIRQQTEAEGRLLARRIRQARRALDQSIYFEETDESTVEARMRELAAAQAEALRLRTLTELRIRRVLTPEQLNILRELRRRAIERQFERRRGASPDEETDAQTRRFTPGGENTSNPTTDDGARPAPVLAPRGRRGGGPRRVRP